MTIRNLVSVFDHVQVGFSRLEVAGTVLGHGFALRMPFGFELFGDFSDPEVGACASTSSMRGFDVVRSDPAARKDGIRTVRGRSFPFELMFGVPIWRDRTRDVCASRR
jgi:hypothetical protein